MAFLKEAVLIQFLLQLQYFDFCKAIQFSEGCSNDASKADNTVLKVVIVVDRTASFSLPRTQMESAVMLLSKEVEKIYPDNEWALTDFSDYPKDATPELGEHNPHSIPEACYGRRYQFSRASSIAYVFRYLRNPNPNGGKENSLHALAQSVVDKELGWEKDIGSKTVKKVAILMTDRGYGDIANPGNRKAYVGDGSDTCSSSKPPTVQKVGEILKIEDVAVIGVFPFGSVEPDVLKTYEEYFNQMSGAPFCGKTFNLATESSPEIISNSIMSCIKQMC